MKITTLVRLQPVGIHDRKIQAIYYPIFVEIRRRVIRQPVGIHNREVNGIDDAASLA